MRDLAREVFGARLKLSQQVREIVVRDAGSRSHQPRREAHVIFSASCRFIARSNSGSYEVTTVSGQQPNIVQIYEIGEHGGLPYFSLEYVDGGSLAERIGGKPQPT